MVDAQALALRRVAVAAAALGGAVVAHMAHGGASSLTLAAPLAWAAVLALAALVGPRRRAFRPRGLPTLFVVLLVAQMTMHAAMTFAPWAFGLTVHHHGASIELSALLAHGAASLVLAVAFRFGERLLARVLRAAQAVAEAIARLLERTPRRALHRGGPLVAALTGVPRVLHVDSRPPRGPPLVVSA